ncbi:MAG: S53 family peptidase [Candidatus Thermoplasmatota archaeon]|nr:S53 family peptidase [Candidatus Thermoplasmatota archaeon]
MPSSGSPYLSDLSFMITFRYSNYTRLVSFLGNLSDPSSPQYGHYLTRGEFIHEFSPRASFYSRAVEYFASHGFSDITAYGDRVSIYMTGSAQLVENTLNVSVVRSGGLYGPTSAPEVPEWMNTYTIGITGLTDRGSASLIGSGHAVMAGSPGAKTASGYGTPINVNGVQYIYGADMQVAYNEQKLLNMTIPKNAVEATILWSGYNKTTGTYTAPFYPQDVYEYYNASIPSGQPHAKVYGVPLNGAPAPGSSAQYDSSGAVFENTLDLEMMGSTAPGSSIYNVYANANSMSQLDANFAYILNPAHTPGLNNVSVISNSWGSNDQNDTTWMTYLQESQARGITVLASSGDSGDNTNSKKYLGGPGYAEFPSSMAYNSFGVTAVGGTSVKLMKDLAIENQSAWYMKAGTSSEGSTGGISTVFREPSWQKNSEANGIINGTGRATPDVSAVANNVIVFITVKGIPYYAVPYFYAASGTSVACPVIAGMVATMNAHLAAEHRQALGFLDPMLYRLGGMENNASHTLSGTSNGTVSPPMFPFYDITSGRNYVYRALFGYDLVTGWGAIDANNLMRQILDLFNGVSVHYLVFHETGLPKDTAWEVEVGNLTLNETGSVIAFNVSSGTFHFTVRSDSSYISNVTSGNITINDSDRFISIAFLSRNDSFPSYEGVFILLAFAMLAVIAMVVIRYSRSRGNL